MEYVTIWMCEDLDDPLASGFGEDKEDAERIVLKNYGYHDYDGYPNKAVIGGWCKEAIEIKVPKIVADCLLSRD